MSAGAVYLRPAGTLALASYDVLQVDASQKTTIGEIGFVADVFGQWRLFTYRRNLELTAVTLTAGSVAARYTINFGTPDSATATKITKAGIFAPATAWNAGLLTCETTVAGADPEGETALIASSDENSLFLDPDLPFSAAPDLAATFNAIAPTTAIANSGAPGYAVAGILMADIAYTYLGWMQFQGLHPRVQHDAAAAVAAGNTVVVSASGVVGDSGGTTFDSTVVGVQWAANPATAGVQLTPVLMTLLPVYS